MSKSKALCPPKFVCNTNCNKNGFGTIKNTAPGNSNTISQLRQSIIAEVRNTFKSESMYPTYKPPIAGAPPSINYPELDMNVDVTYLNGFEGDGKTLPPATSSTRFDEGASTIAVNPDLLNNVILSINPERPYTNVDATNSMEVGGGVLYGQNSTAGGTANNMSFYVAPTNTDIDSGTTTQGLGFYSVNAAGNLVPMALLIPP